MPGDTEAYSNPIAPPQMMETGDPDDLHPMTNADFRKLLMTPRVPNAGAVPSSAPPSRAAKISSSLPENAEDGDDDAATRRKKKKSYYANLKKLEEERQKELSEKYRDRAQERREGQNKDYDQTEFISTTADYRAVAPDAKSGEHYAERRKKVIQESKYLGGDMEHTHLVKGLDYALLDKVRAEINIKENEETQLENLVLETKPEEEKKEVQIDFKTKLGRSVFRTLFQNKPPERNELFLPGRMAYVVDLEDEYAECDIPTTLIRSKADCPSIETTTTLTTNDIVINKLTQILSYLRQGKRDKKKLKKGVKGKEDEKIKEKLPGADDNIYADVGDYVPSGTKSNRDRGDRKDRDRGDRENNRERRDRGDRRDRGGRGSRWDRDREREERDREREERDREREERSGGGGGRDRDRDDNRDRRDRGRDYDNREKKRSYFEKPVEDEDHSHGPTSSAKDLVKSINEKYGSKGQNWGSSSMPIPDKPKGMPKMKEDERLKKLKRKMAISSYAECYPGMAESADAIDDSDDEVDYTKMDMGNKKGPVGRWDFDTQEEYSDYMANKEALPKAAFQYGVKMADGRKTRRAGPKDEKAQLDREWQKIQNIIQKRKKTGEGY
ncbi:protein Red-like [Tubulanus polymorphus]|uniref:protein Red-like n=1 Tax=Tubulanus polymorphus TaxID=672921 RepID=UPI003DA2E71E